MATSSESKTFKLEIVTPERKVLSGEAEFAVFPGTDGDLGILPRHAPILSQLGAGEMKVVQQGKSVYYAISGGFLEVKENKVTVAVETCEAASEIDQERARKSKQLAQTLLQEKKDKAELLEAVHRAKRAEARLKVALKAAQQDQSKH
jgi:F-type H+-transporting ATPase subunit epsilon